MSLTPDPVESKVGGGVNSLTIAGAVLLLLHIVALSTITSVPNVVLASNLIQASASVVASIACISAARRAKTLGQSVWGACGSAFLLWTVAQGFWTYKEYVYGVNAVQLNFTDVLFFFSFAPFALLLLLNSSPDQKDGIDWQRTLDVVQLAIVLFCAYLYVFYVPSRWETQEQGMRRMIGEVFLSRNVLICAGLLLKTMLSSTKRERSLFGNAALMMISYAVFTRFANLARLRWDHGTGSWFDLGWNIPFLIAVVLATRWNEPNDTEAELFQKPGLRRTLALHLTPTLVPALVLYLGASIAAEQMVIASVAILSSFTCYSLRLWVTQYRQEKAVDALRQTEQRFRLLFSHNPQPIWVYELSTLQFLEVNDAAIRKYGYSRDEFLARKITDIRPVEDVPLLMEGLNKEGAHAAEWRHQSKDGKVFEVLVLAEPVEFSGRNCELVIVQDISERKQLEEQLRQAQKMEAVGTLAGGIAHDFNNLLTVITGYSQVVLERSRQDEQLTREVQQIEIAANRATGLVRQLLAFSRRQVIQPQILNLDDVVAGVERMLKRLIGEHIELKVRSSPDLAFVKADPGQLEQILINLAVNARDAIEEKSTEGGRIIFSTQNVVLDEEFTRDHIDAKPGAYVMLLVSDTGSGMNESVRARIFEPFFTTKKGTGTGLGLSTVYGIVQQSNGYITVDSEVGTGTTFKLYLPQAVQGRVANKHVESSHSMRAGCETILLVEDDDGLRELALRILGKQGYHVLSASRSSEAEQLCREHEGQIDIVVTDVVMPGLGGRELVTKLLPIQPQMAVLFMSGYTDQVVFKEGVEKGNTHFIQKPFTPASLSKKVREVLDRESRAD